MDEIDPIQLLQQYAANKDCVQLMGSEGSTVSLLSEAHSIAFNGRAFPCKHPTSLKRSNAEDYYTIESLLYMIDRRTDNYIDYLKSGVAANITTVAMMDRSKLLSMLSAAGGADAASGKRMVLDSGVVGGLHLDKHTGSDPGQVARFSEQDIAAAGRVIEREQAVMAKDMLLCSGRPFDDVYKRVRDLLSQQSSRKRTDTTSKDASADSGTKSRPIRKGARIPIIIVPAAATSMINMFNVQQFLQEHTFVEASRAGAASSARPTSVTLERSEDGQDGTTVYQVLDSVERLRPDDWKRVVAVFTTGAEWQFKNWLWQNPLEIFNNVKGFYVKFADEPAKENILRWNVTTLDIQRHKRHTDRVVVGEFWDALNAFIAAKRPYLLHG